MTGPTRPDEDMGDFGPDLDALSARYQAESRDIEPPQHLHAQLLATAHRAVDAKPRAPGAASGRSMPVMRRMRAPLGLAATIVAVASITVALWKESPEKLEIPSDHAPAARAPTASTGQHADSSGAVAVTILPARPAAPLPALTAAAPAALPAPMAAPARQKAAQQLGGKQGPYAEAAASAPAIASAKKTEPAQTRAADSVDQPADARARSEQSLDRVTVTGSNLKRADTETSSPVQVITLPEAAPVSSPPAPSASAQVLAATAPAPLARAASSPVPAPSPPPPGPSASQLAAVQARAAPPPAPQIAARSSEPAPPPPAAGRAPALSYLPPPAASVQVVKPDAARDAATAPAPGETSLLAALQTAADAGDAVAARVVLETLKKNYPQAQIPATLRGALNQLGISVPGAR